MVRTMHGSDSTIRTTRFASISNQENPRASPGKALSMGRISESSQEGRKNGRILGGICKNKQPSALPIFL